MLTTVMRGKRFARCRSLDIISSAPALVNHMDSTAAAAAPRSHLRVDRRIKRWIVDRFMDIQTKGSSDEWTYGERMAVQGQEGLGTTTKAAGGLTAAATDR